MSRKARELEHYFVEHPKSKAKFGIIQACLRGNRLEFLTSSGVFSKEKIDLGTRLLIECMILPEKGYVLDLGCGYGAVGISAAASNPDLHVVMVDVNYRAAWLARQNLQRNCIFNADVKRGNLFEPLEDDVFDCVLSNPPVSAGLEVVKAMIQGAPDYMAKKASFQMVIRSKVAGKRFCGFFEEAFGNVEVLARESGYRVLISKKV
jgi:16S rRNA (guanine1207-N2)-methyltransferase